MSSAGALGCVIVTVGVACILLEYQRLDLGMKDYCEGAFQPAIIHFGETTCSRKLTSWVGYSTRVFEMVKSAGWGAWSQYRAIADRCNMHSYESNSGEDVSYKIK
jgi:hypothetical protein